MRHNKPSAERRRAFWKKMELQMGRLYCVYCKNFVRRDLPPDHPFRATMDHVVPMVYGGVNAQTNLVVACYRCNQNKGDGEVYA